MLQRTSGEAWKERHNAIHGERCRETSLAMLSSDMTDTRGERVAWGPTALLDRAGSVLQQARLNEEALLVADLPV